MAIITDLAKIKPLLAAGKAVQKIAAEPPPNEDGWAKIERIITGIDSMLDHMIALKNQGGQNSPSGNTRQILTEPSHAASQADNNAVQAGKNEGNKLKIPPQLIQFFENFFNDCVKENPNMTLGDAIAKLPVNVTQIAALISLAKGRLK
jgi:hypothetical protein